MKSLDYSFGVVVVWPRSSEAEPYRFLLVHHQKNHWDFPKGHAEPGETPLETATREVLEETGVTVTVDDPTVVFEERYTFINQSGVEVTKTVQFFLGQPATIFEGNPTSALQIQEAEIQNAEWLTAVEAMRRITFPAGRELLAQVVTYLESHPFDIMS